MGQGYVRNDVSNNIDNGNVINADDLDGEFEALEDAFAASTGHTHDGTTAEGGPVSVVGPVQDLVVSTTSVLPKTTATLDLGGASKTFKDGYFSGEVTATTFTGDLVGSAGAVDNALTVGSGLSLSSGTTYDGSAAVTISTDLDGIYARLASGNNFTVSQTITADFARLNFTDTNFTTGSNKFSMGAIANGTFGVFALNDGGTLKEELIRFEPAGSSISDSQAAVTLEKGDNRFAGLAAPNVFTSTQTISNTAPEQRYFDTDATAGFAMANWRFNGGQLVLQTRTDAGVFVANNIIVSQNASGATDFSFLIGGVEALKIEAAGTSISDPQAAVTLEKGDARFAPLPTTSTSANLTTYPIGERISVAGLIANEPDRNEAKTIYIITDGSETAAFTYENPSPTPASTLVGTWRSRGRCSGAVSGLAFYTFVRTA